MSAGVLIANVWHTGAGTSIDVVNPVTGALLASLTGASVAQVAAAVAAAHGALAGWRLTSPAERGELLGRIATQVEASRPRLEALQRLNNGKPAFEAGLDVSDVVATFRYYADLCVTGSGLLAQDVPLPDEGFKATLEQVPVGVVGLVVPWNFPMVTTAWKLAPALAAGCTVVLKPSELTPLAEIALLEIILAAGCPAGVVNMVCGAGDVGQALVQHPQVAKVSFTGSNATGQSILQASAARMQRVSLELGGKSSLIVLEDANLERAVELAAGGAFFNAGQMCSATSRIIVAEPLYVEFVERLVTAAQALRHGEPEAEDTTLGPIISLKQKQAVLQRIATGKTDGAQLLTGGTAIQGLGGFAIAPTVFTAPEHSTALWQEEIFGPVACVRSVHSDALAAEMANDSAYGLVATIVSDDTARAQRVAAQLDVGMVWINTPQLIFPQTSWGGFKHSSLGRELGPWGLQAFQEVRHTLMPS